MNKVSVFVAAKTKTPVECVKLKPAQTYSDSIIKGLEYTNHLGKSIVVINYCNQPFTIQESILFSDIVNGGNFTAKIASFTIQANQMLNIPVIYNGVYLGDNLSPNYNITINGTQNIYSLTVSVPVINQPPVISDITIELNNRQSHTFTLEQFLAHFTDLDGDTIDTVWAEGNVSGYKLAGANYVSGTEVTKTQINSGLFQYYASNTNAYTESIVVWKARDTAGTISQN